ncbi:MAG: hypothetical protein LQ343_004513 [Gyalolechia ehrenbergii]|nr:MAG: hypothetical protein LQ343_004513 [Gyalolechia ehrenbergii]
MPHRKPLRNGLEQFSLYGIPKLVNSKTAMRPPKLMTGRETPCNLLPQLAPTLSATLASVSSSLGRQRGFTTPSGLAKTGAEEADRLESQHQVLNLVFDGRHFFPPVQRVRSVLDCGYGAASWGVEVAETYPDCTVIGVDISPHMKPDDLPENFIAQVRCPNSEHQKHPFFLYPRMGYGARGKKVI